ncbi:MAG: arylesterase [Xanthomonadales bacterium]|nr:arylesterase [Xanthomonadales bacterium]
MKGILAVLVISLGLFSDSVLAEEPPVILIMGDSLSAGYEMNSDQSWVHLLKLKLHQEGYSYRIQNSSISGDTTGGGLARLPRLLKKYQPEIVIIELGANDGLQGMNPSVTRDNMSRMVQSSQAIGAKVLLAGIKLPPNYGADYIQQFESIYTDIAHKFDTLLVPFFMQGVALKPELLLDDGIHPNVKGQPVLLDNVWQVLAPVLK